MHARARTLCTPSSSDLQLARAAVHQGGGRVPPPMHVHRSRRRVDHAVTAHMHAGACRRAGTRDVPGRAYHARCRNASTVAPVVVVKYRNCVYSKLGVTRLDYQAALSNSMVSGVRSVSFVD